MFDAYCCVYDEQDFVRRTHKKEFRGACTSVMLSAGVVLVVFWLALPKVRVSSGYLSPMTRGPIL